MPLSAGTLLGRYQIRSPLGAGGMGEVYLAQDIQLDRTVALKILPANVAADRQRMQRFIQEAKVASGLNHPNILTIYEIGQTESTHFIATEYIEGETLRHHLSDARIGLSELLDVCVQVAGALATAHKAGIIHRDIKPENIMIRRDGIVKVLDFGLAKLTERQPSTTDTEAPTKAMVNTSAGAVMGTASYMSPEQARGQAVDARTDIWSLGVVLHEMIAGRVPFEGATPSDVIAKILEREPPPLVRYLPEVPAELERIVTKALTKDREERYQTIKDLLIDLRRLKQRQEVEVEIERTAPAQVSGARVAMTSDREEAIKTVHAKRIADIEGTHPTSSAEYLVSEIKRHKRGAILAVTMLVMAVAAVFWLYTLAARKQSQPNTTAPFQAMKMIRLTTTANVTNAAISPDGKYVVYATNYAGKQSLSVRQVATTSNVQIVPPVETEYLGLTFSRDSNYIYYIRAERNSAPALYQVSVLGGASRRVMRDAPDSIALSPDGKQFAFVRGDPTAGDSSLMIANAPDGSVERKLTTRRQPEFLGQPAWSPDGRVIASAVGKMVGGVDMTVITVQVADGAQRPITSQRWVDVGQVAWLGDGSGLVMLVADHGFGAHQLWHVSYPGGEVRRITNDLNAYDSVSLTADSTGLASVQSINNLSVWVAPNGEASRARQITSGVATNSDFWGFAWTPDRKILYVSTAGGNADIWMMDADGGDPKQLTANARDNFDPAVTPNGRYIVFASTRSGSGEIWRMDVDGGNPKQLTNVSAAQPQVSPDGQWVLYWCLGCTPWSLWKVSIEGGTPVRLTDRTSTWPSVSPDGKLIACRWEEPGKPQRIAIMPFEGGQPIKTFDLPPTALRWGEVRWRADGRALTYVDTRDGVRNIWSQPMDGSPPKQLTDFKGEQIIRFEWSRDGKQLVCSRSTVTSDVVLIKDFK